MATSGLPWRTQVMSMATTAPAVPASTVVTATGVTAESAKSSEPPLKPNQPTSRIMAPMMAKGMEWPGMARALPSGPYLPMRGPRMAAPTRAAMPPVMCTMPEPAKSW